MFPERCPSPCPPACPGVFDRVVVSYLLRSGAAQVAWTLRPDFTDPGPLTFTLQVGSTSSQDADDWQDVGLPVVDRYSAADGTPRLFGKSNWTHYRVRLDSPRGSHHSDPTGLDGTLDRRSWRLARELVRQRLVAYRYGPGGQQGYLLKRRWTGLDCQVCTDLQTHESRDPFCPSCWGTGKQCGYFYPVSCVWAETSPRNVHSRQDPELTRGTVRDVVLKAELLMTHLVDELDVWVNKVTDDRYYIHGVTNTAEVRGFPLVAQAELRLIQYTSPVYGIAVPEQLADLEGA